MVCLSCVSNLAAFVILSLNSYSIKKTMISNSSSRFFSSSVVLFSSIILLSLTLEQAKQKAFTIWDKAGFARISGKNYQVGCVNNGQTKVIAQSKTSFDDAFAHVDMKRNGHHKLTAVVIADDGETAESTPVDVILCNP